MFEIKQALIAFLKVFIHENITEFKNNKSVILIVISFIKLVSIRLL